MPKSTGAKSHQASTEAGLLASRRNSQIDVIPQPVARVDIPSSKVSTRVLRCLDSPGINVLQTVPEDLARGRVNTIVTHSREDTSAFGKVPNTVVL